ncbi:hypothetical protein FOA52_006427 [Chlamydomonas sp. UWO 241]|nr:hypothetical protein FOA52_006427 [Chlamydomonas sp. UWO 241]
MSMRELLQDISFPYAKCQAYSCQDSPWGMYIKSKESGKVCYQMYDNGCKSDGCCNVLRERTHKVQFKTNPLCKREIDTVFINGVEKPYGIYFDVFDENNAMFRITNLDWTELEAATAEICITLKRGVCAAADAWRLAEEMPDLLAMSGRELLQEFSFPYAQCQAYSCRDSPWGMYIKSKESGKVCYQMYDNGCKSDGCCNVLRERTHKIQFRTNPICKREVDQVFINGVVKPYGLYFDVFDETNAAFRITNLDWTELEAATAEICITLKRGVCRNPDDFCYGADPGQCYFSSFDYASSQLCCPTMCVLASNFTGMYAALGNDYGCDPQGTSMITCGCI